MRYPAPCAGNVPAQAGEFMGLICPLQSRSENIRVALAGGEPWGLEISPLPFADDNWEVEPVVPRGRWANRKASASSSGSAGSSLGHSGPSTPTENPRSPLDLRHAFNSADGVAVTKEKVEAAALAPLAADAAPRPCRAGITGPARLV